MTTTDLPGFFQVMLSRKMLSRGCQEGVPALVTDGRRLIPKQNRLDIVRLPPVLLQYRVALCRPGS